MLSSGVTVSLLLLLLLLSLLLMLLFLMMTMMMFFFQVRSFGVLGWPGSHGETRAGGKPSIIHQPSLLLP